MDTQTQAAPSTAIPASGSAEYAQWRATGELPKETPKPADTASADTSKETTADDAGSSAAKDTQEQQRNRRRPDVEARFKHYSDRIEALERELEQARRPKETKADSSPAKPAAPTNYQDWRKGFKPAEWTAQYIKDNPQASWEDAQASLADYMADVRDQYRSVEQQITQQRQTVGQKLNEARERYQDFDSVATPVLQDMLKPDISREVFNVINDSPVLADLLYVIGGTDASKQDFLDACRSNPSKALRMALLMENEIVRERGKAKDQPRTGKGQFTKPDKVDLTPAKRGPENTPAPPIEIGHRGTGAMDETERAFSDIGRGNPNAVRDWLKAENAKDLRRRRGV